MILPKPQPAVFKPVHVRSALTKRWVYDRLLDDGSDKLVFENGFGCVHKADLGDAFEIVDGWVVFAKADAVTSPPYVTVSENLKKLWGGP